MTTNPHTPADRALHAMFIAQNDLSRAIRDDLAELPNVRPVHEDDLPFTACIQCDDTRVVYKGHATINGWVQEPYPCPNCAGRKR